MAVWHLRVDLTNFLGGPGMNSWFGWSASDTPDPAMVNSMAAGLRTFYDAIKSNLVISTQANFNPDVRLYDPVSGAVVGQLGATPWGSAVTGAGSGQEARSTSLKLQLVTGAVAGSRLVRGGCYLGPAASIALGSDGQVDPAVRTAVRTALSTFATGWPLYVWHRPKDGSGGSAHRVSSVNVDAVPAVQRRRAR